MTGPPDPDALRGEVLDRWQRAASHWAARRDWVRTFGMPVSRAMIDAVSPHPGQRVLELAAGIGDTGFLAAELVRPGGTLISSDAADGMLEQARARARELGAENVEFARLELEWIDLPTAAVDTVLCRWGLMFAVDPEAALREARRVLRPGGRIALAAWDEPEHNPWSTIPTSALVTLGHMEPPDPSVPGMFILSAPGMLEELLYSAGFTEVNVRGVDFAANYTSLDSYLEVTRDLSRQVDEALSDLPDADVAAVRREMERGTAPFAAARDGSLSLPARSLVASAGS